MKRFVIVGGGPAGLCAARAYREAGGEGSVEIIGSERVPPYRRPPLTKEFLRDEISASELPIEDESWYEKNEVRLTLETEVTSLDRERKVLTSKAAEEFPYDACVLATGSFAVRPPIPGADDPGVHVVRTFEDSASLSEKFRGGGRALVVGSGFIGCEAAASLSMRGARVVQVSLEETPQEARLGKEVGEKIRGWLEGYAVDLKLGVPLEEIRREGDSFVARLGTGEKVRAEMVVLGAGAKPRTEPARRSGLKIEEGGVLCGASMRTSDANVFAAGDIAYARNTAAGRNLRVEHWGEALGQGRVAGTVAAGGEAAWDSAPGFWSTIGSETLKYVAWGDGFDEASFTDHGGGSFTARYGLGGVLVGVLTHDRDEDYERGREQVEAGASFAG